MEDTQICAQQVPGNVGAEAALGVVRGAGQGGHELEFEPEFVSAPATEAEAETSPHTASAVAIEDARFMNAPTLINK